MIDLQPLKIISGWTIEWNTFMEVDSHADDMSAFSGSNLLHAYNDHSKRAINLEWKPEEDFEGVFFLRVINLYEEYNPHTKKIDLSGDWEQPHYEFTSRKRLEIVAEIERLMLQLYSFVDPRIMESPGVVDKKVELLRLKLIEKGISDALSEKILESNNHFIQDLLIDHETVRKIDLKN